MFAVGALMLAGFAVAAPSAHASVMLNGGVPGGSDCPTVMVSTASTGGGSTDCYPTSESTSAGSVINAIIYYHNDSSAETAHNVTVRLSPQTAGASTSQVFTGSVSASNGNTATGSATMGISSAQSITFLSARWFKDQTTYASLPGSGAAIFSGAGLNLGDIPGYGDCPVTGGVRNDFCHEGWIQVAYQV